MSRTVEGGGSGCEEGKRGWSCCECCVGRSAMREGDLATSARNRGQAGRTSQPLRVAPASWDDFLGHMCLLASQVTEAGPALIRGNMAYETGRAFRGRGRGCNHGAGGSTGRGVALKFAAKPARRFLPAVDEHPWPGTRKYTLLSCPKVADIINIRIYSLI